jgi:hypothetical protein
MNRALIHEQSTHHSIGPPHSGGFQNRSSATWLGSGHSEGFWMLSVDSKCHAGANGLES